MSTRREARRSLSAGRQWRQAPGDPPLHPMWPRARARQPGRNDSCCCKPPLAAVFGTVVMTLSSTTEMQWVQRPASVVPGLATAKLLRPFGVREVKGRALDILATWTHWGYGALWGRRSGALLGPLGLPVAAAGEAVALQLLPWAAGAHGERHAHPRPNRKPSSSDPVPGPQRDPRGLHVCPGTTPGSQATRMGSSIGSGVIGRSPPRRRGRTGPRPAAPSVRTPAGEPRCRPGTGGQPARAPSAARPSATPT
jgi:hypothetical protein